MADIVPSKLRSNPTRGESRLHALLATLPDGCVSYYEPNVDGRHPDFVVLIPSVGILVIEEKGYCLPVESSAPADAPSADPAAPAEPAPAEAPSK